jgi:hypothetical protein
MSRPDDPPPDPAGLMRDWMTMWQSESAGLAGDRELNETLAQLGAMSATIWSQVGERMRDAGFPPAAQPDATHEAGGERRAGRREPAGHTGTDAPPRPAAADDAPGPIRAIAGELHAIRDAINALERRVARLERAARAPEPSSGPAPDHTAAPPGPDAPPRKRRRTARAAESGS